MLKKVHFNATHDTLVHAGDVINKGPHSRKVLQELIGVKALGVRGNQDQKVVEWRAWVNWVVGQKGGKEWLHKMEKRVEATVSKLQICLSAQAQAVSRKNSRRPTISIFGSLLLPRDGRSRMVGNLVAKFIVWLGQ